MKTCQFAFWQPRHGRCVSVARFNFLLICQVLEIFQQLNILISKLQTESFHILPAANWLEMLAYWMARTLSVYDWKTLYRSSFEEFTVLFIISLLYAYVWPVSLWFGFWIWVRHWQPSFLWPFDSVLLSHRSGMGLPTTWPLGYLDTLELSFGVINFATSAIFAACWDINLMPAMAAYRVSVSASVYFSCKGRRTLFICHYGNFIRCWLETCITYSIWTFSISCGMAALAKHNSKCSWSYGSRRSHQDHTNTYTYIYIRSWRRQQNAKRKCRQYPNGNRWKFIENCAQIKFYVCLLFSFTMPASIFAVFLTCFLFACLWKMWKMLLLDFWPSTRFSLLHQSDLHLRLLFLLLSGESHCC